MIKRIGIIGIGIVMTVTTACSSGGSVETANKEKPKTKEGKTIITLSMKEPSPFYQVVEKKFEEKYPDIDLQIQTYKKMGEKWGGGDFENYKKTTNTALLSGKGADILEVSDLPVGEYVSKQLLVNMNDFMDKDQTLNKNDLHMNILKAIQLNGGWYTMPSAFSLRAFVGDGDILKKAGVNVDDKNWTWPEFAEISKKLMKETEKNSKERRYALANDPPELLLQEMVVDSYAELVDRAALKAKFDSPLFGEMMQQIKKMYDDKVMTSESADFGKQLFYSTVITSPADFIEGPYSLFANPKLMQKPHAKGQNGGMRIIPSSQFAIQAKSPVKEEAWKFIAFMLSADVQSLQDRGGFSLLRSVNEKVLSEIQAQVKSGTFKLDSGKGAKVPDEQFTQFKQLIQTADRFAGLDSKVISIVGDESRAFFSGQKSAEEVAKLIQNRATTYLNE
ncbi:extracellular solute-binding protein [Paenibacillus sp. RC67]|uniref:ABC transporter substrate-binding protein n=1 Tax=Paenibacillus sp. RC67 TaxID=3039392 RepID=UPI0024AD74C2|nr:extracellular solute-binding protein [Paenibacillus sp. RC67]